MHSWTVTATHPLTAETVDLSPILEGLEFSKQRENGQQFFRHKLESGLVFKGTDYDWLRAIEQDATANCEKVLATVKYGTTAMLSGYLSTSKGKWWPDRKEATLDFYTEDDATCFMEKWKISRNLLDATPKVTIKSFAGEVVTIPCGPKFQPSGVQFASPVTIPLESWADQSCLPGGANDGNWVDIDLHFTNIAPDGNGFFSATVNVVWASQQLPNGDYQLPQVVYDFENSQPDYTQGNLRRVRKIVGGEFPELSNALTLETALDFYASECGLTVASDLFGINPVGDAPSNEAYTEAADHHQGIHILQKTDVTRNDALNDATKLTLTAEEFFSQFAALYKAYPYPVGNTLRFEHISYFKPSTVILDISNLTLTQGGDSYEWEAETAPVSTDFSFIEEVSAAFEGFPFVFPSACSSDDREEVQANKTNTDFRFMFGQPTTDTGMVVAATTDVQGETVLESRTMPNGTFEFLNGSMSYQHLQTFHRFEMPAATYTLNGVAQTALSVRASRNVAPIKVKGISPADWLAFDPSVGKVKTPFADCEVTKAVWESKSGTMTLELAF